MTAPAAFCTGLALAAALVSLAAWLVLRAALRERGSLDGELATSRAYGRARDGDVDRLREELRVARTAATDWSAIASDLQRQLNERPDGWRSVRGVSC
jgi:hypothetical protein